VAQAVGHLPNKHKVGSSNPSTAKKKREEYITHWAKRMQMMADYPLKIMEAGNNRICLSWDSRAKDIHHQN
jgi:hypothetical protein